MPTTSDEIPVEARQNEYAVLSDRELAERMQEAVQVGDWETASKIQVATIPSGEVPRGVSLRVQSDFIDRR